MTVRRHEPSGLPAAPAQLPPWLRGHPGGWLIDLIVQPGARHNLVDGEHGARLRVRVNAPPVDGKANLAVQEVVAARLGCRRSDITLVGGQTSRLKTLRVELDRAAADLVRALRAPG